MALESSMELLKAVFLSFSCSKGRTWEEKGAKRRRGGKAPLLPLEEQDIYTAAEAVLLLIVFTWG